jgi:hypothetical protein
LTFNNVEFFFSFQDVLIKKTNNTIQVQGEKTLQGERVFPYPNGGVKNITFSDP